MLTEGGSADVKAGSGRSRLTRFQADERRDVLLAMAERDQPPIVGDRLFDERKTDPELLPEALDDGEVLGEERRLETLRKLTAQHALAALLETSSARRRLRARAAAVRRASPGVRPAPKPRKPPRRCRPPSLGSTAFAARPLPTGPR